MVYSCNQLENIFETNFLYFQEFFYDTFGLSFIFRYLRQYHEERDGKEIKTQEYFLGKFSKDKFQELLVAETKDKVTNAKYRNFIWKICIFKSLWVFF